MTEKAMTETSARHLASIIRKCYSEKYLAQVATEMGETILPSEDIFQSLIRAGRALDLETAVALVAAHIYEEGTHYEDVPMFLRKDRRSDSKNN